MFKGRARQSAFWPEELDPSNQISAGSQRIPALSPVLGVVAAIAGLYFLRAIFLPLAFAVILMVFLSPIVSFLQRIVRLPRAASVAATMLATMIFVFYAGWLLTDQTLQIAEKLPAYRGNIRTKITALMKRGRLGQTAAQVKDMTNEIAGAATLPSNPAVKISTLQPRPVPVEIQEPKGGLTGIAEVGAMVLGPIGQVGFVIILTVYMLMNREDLRDRVLRLCGSRGVGVAIEAMDDGAKRIGKYLLLQLLTNVGFGTCVSLGLYFIGLPNALLWGALAAFARFIPYAGSLLGASFPAMLAFAISPDWIQPILVICLFLALDLVTAYGIEPILFGAHTGISAFALLVSAAFWTIIWGLPGLVLSTPLTVCAVILGQYIPGLSVLHVLLGDQPALSPEAQMYQRLLAMDLLDAKGIAQKYLAANDLQHFYDNLLLPALRLAENDRSRGFLESSRAAGFYAICSELIGDLSGGESLDENEVMNHSIPRRIICIPRGSGDFLVCSMFAQLMEAKGAGVIVLPLNWTVLDIKSIDLQRDDVVLISFFSAPAGQIKTLLQILRADFPDSIRIEGRWRMPQDTLEGSEQNPVHANRIVVHTLRSAVEAIETLVPRDAVSAFPQLFEKKV